MPKVLALVLDDPAHVGGEPVHFSNFPGRWVPGEPVRVSLLGFATDDEALARAEELGLPLSATRVDRDKGDMPAVEQLEPGLALEPGEAFPPDPVVSVEALAEEFEPALERVAADVVHMVGITETPEALDAIELAEKQGSSRKTVLTAIKERRAELEAAAAAPAEETP